MKTVSEVIAFLESEIKRLQDLGTYGDDVDYLKYLVSKIIENNAT